MKKFLALILAGALALSMVACSSGSDSGSTSGTGNSGTTESAKAPDNDMVVAMQADATSIDPHVGSNGNSNLIIDQMYETLVTFDENTNVIGALAKEWSVSEDGKSYTFVLNEGITFHDGEPFNAEAVRQTYLRGLNDSSLTLQRTIGTKDNPIWEDVVVDSEYQVTIKLVEPNNTFINKICQFRIVSPKVVEMDNATEYLSKNSAGTGPFKLDSRVDGGYTKMVPYENYWREGPSVDSLTFQVVPEDGARVAMLQTGEADIITPFPVLDVEAVDGKNNIKVEVVPSTTYRYVTLNVNYTLEDGRKPFSDVRVRQALNYAFDSKAYAQVVFNGYAKEPTSIFSDAIYYYAEQTPYTADLEKAKALMEEAGYADGFPVEIICDNTTIEQKGAEFVKQQLAQINVDVKLLPNESTANADITSLPEEEATVQMWYVNWSSGSYEADGSMRSILHGDKFPPNGYNTAFWNNEEFNELLDKALVETDTDKIAEYYAEAQAIAWEECPWIFLGNDQSLNAMKTYVTGMLYKPAGVMVFRTIGLDV